MKQERKTKTPDIPGLYPGGLLQARYMLENGYKLCGVMFKAGPNQIMAVSQTGHVTKLDKSVMAPLAADGTENKFPDCDTCGSPMDYMPWHYATETERHLHACDECWPKVNPATNTNRNPVAFAVYMGGGVIELHHAPLPDFDQKPHMVLPLFTAGDTWLDHLNMFSAAGSFPAASNGQNHTEGE